MKADTFGAPTQKAQLLITKCLCNYLVRWSDLLLLGSALPKALFTPIQVPQESMPSMFTPCLHYHRKGGDENSMGTEDPGLRARRSVGLAEFPPHTLLIQTLATS